MTPEQERAKLQKEPAIKVREEPPRRRKRLPLGGCAYCDAQNRARDPHHPPHDASPNCESGKKPHCTCDVCW